MLLSIIYAKLDTDPSRVNPHKPASIFSDHPTVSGYHSDHIGGRLKLIWIFLQKNKSVQKLTMCDTFIQHFLIQAIQGMQICV